MNKVPELADFIELVVKICVGASNAVFYLLLVVIEFGIFVFQGLIWLLLHRLGDFGYEELSILLWQLVLDDNRDLLPAQM